MFWNRGNKENRHVIFQLETERLFLTILSPAEAPAVADYLARNRDFHQPYHQHHDDIYFTPREQRSYLQSDLSGYYDNRQFGFWLSYKDAPERIIGRLAFTAVIRGALNSCLMGYHLDQEATGMGLMQEAIRRGCQYIFHVQKLHRIQADIMPTNLPSQKTVERSGFRRQGLNEKYMEINGVWQDHYCYALINDPLWTASLFS